MVVAYPLALQPSDVSARRTSSRSSKKKASKKKRAVKTAAKIETSENTEATNSSNETTEPVKESTTSAVANTVTETVQTAPATSSATTETSTNETASQSGEVKDMSKDAKWEEFRICMQTSCAGSDEQPNNVECYKGINFDNVFMNCKMLVEENKREDFKNYFTGPFLKQEKKTFCENDNYGGKFDETSGKCAVSVKYTRPAYNGKQFQCGKESKSLTWYIDNKNYVCDADLFGVGECYKDSAGYTAAQTQKWMGVAQLAIGAASAIGTGLAAASKGIVKKTTTDTNGNTSVEKEQVTYTAKFGKNKGKEVTRDKWNAMEGISAGWSAGSGMIATGAGQLAEGMIMEKEKGDRIFGICTLPNGTVISEGNSIKLSW